MNHRFNTESNVEELQRESNSSMFKDMCEMKNYPANWAPIWGCNLEEPTTNLLNDSRKNWSQHCTKISNPSMHQTRSPIVTYNSEDIELREESEGWRLKKPSTDSSPRKSVGKGIDDPKFSFKISTTPTELWAHNFFTGAPTIEDILQSTWANKRH